MPVPFEGPQDDYIWPRIDSGHIRHICPIHNSEKWNPVGYIRQKVARLKTHLISRTIYLPTSKCLKISNIIIFLILQDSYNRI